MADEPTWGPLLVYPSQKKDGTKGYLTLQRVEFIPI
jgi:hypothetical protein